MKQTTTNHSIMTAKTWDFLSRIAVVFVMVSPFGCTYPGALATSTAPIPEEFVEIAEEQEASSCGYAFLMLPLGSPEPMAEIINDMIQNKGGDALINVSSESTSTFFILGSANCVNIRGTVVKFG